MDARIAALVRSGSDEALDALHGRYADEIQAIAYLILRDRFEAEDVMAETLISAWKHGRRLRSEASVRPWLLKVATNHALAIRRKRRQISSLDGADVPIADPTGPLAGRIALVAAVDRLPVEMRAAVVLRYFADLSVEDVARTLGKSPNTVKSQLRVALDRLRASSGDPSDGRLDDVG